MENQRHYFWIYQWNTKKFSEGFSNPCFLCEIGDDGLRIHDAQKPVFITWDQISACDMELNIGSHVTISQFVRVKIKDDALIPNLNNAKTIYLVPMDTLRARFWHDSHEADNLLNVIASHLGNKPISLHPNPYYRGFERINQVEYFELENWDPHIPPKDFIKHPIMKNALLRSNKNGFLVAYGLTTAFIVFIALILFSDKGEGYMDGIAVMGGMWIILTAAVGWYMYLANQDFTRK
jgi:hypothetical protein